MSDEASDAFRLNVIIPARNAAATIAATLESLVSQTYTWWQAIVVDDGSTDATARIASDAAARDERIRVLPGPQRGVGAARNLGLAASSAPWVLFLDADDSVVPEMMEKMVAGLRAHPNADAIHCGWTFTDSDGTPIGSRRCEVIAADLFPLFADYCAFVIHACVIRRSQLEKSGGFDETLRTNEDFDLWQRVGRIGTRFISIPESLSLYRLRPNATWFNASLFLDDALRVVRRGHAADPRLPVDLVAVEHRYGAPADGLAPAELRMLVWAGALAIAHKENWSSLVDKIEFPPEAAADPRIFGEAIFQAVPLALCQPVSSWKDLFPKFIEEITRFLKEIEQRWNMPTLQERALRALEARIIPEIVTSREANRTLLVLGKWAVFDVDVETPIPDVILTGIDRAICTVHAGDTELGSVMLPVADGILPAIVMTDAIAGRFAWKLLELFFQKQRIYDRISIAAAADTWSVSRGGVTLGVFPSDPSGSLHDRVGWTIFLQELFGLSGNTNEEFYGNKDLQPHSSKRLAGAENVFELTQPIPSLVGAPDGTFNIRATIGGAPVASGQVQSRSGIASEADLRLMLLSQGRMELVRTAVREGILECPLDDSRGLNQRLHEAAAKRSADYPYSLIDTANGAVIVLGGTRSERSEEIARRLTLPAAAADLLIESAAMGQPILRIGHGPVRQVLFLPELAGTRKEQAGAENVFEHSHRGLYDRHHFESLFAEGVDPWQYTSQYEQTKYAQTLAMLPEGHREKVLEIGCAEGHFTEQLLPLVQSLTVGDISQIALRRAADRCGAADKISFVQMDLASDRIDSRYNLIVCSEVLYYMSNLEVLKAVGRKLATALEPDGYLVTVHANLVIDEPTATGFDWRMPYGSKVIGETLGSLAEFVFEKELRTPLYRIQRFRLRRFPALRRIMKSAAITPSMIESAAHAAPEPDVAAHILWSGGQVAAVENTITTPRLPILMYHNVAETGPVRLARWRVSPHLFAAQMRYLKEAGFTTATLDEWRRARREGKALSGRRMLITFDDGYAGFEELALPALRANDFSAMMFVPTTHVGGMASWDGADGEQLPLMGWSALRRLRDAGIEIGAHSRSHARLTDLAFEDLVDELAGARLTIHRELATSVDALAYPFGASDEVVMRVAAACGYVHGLTTREGASGLDEDGLSLSRIEVVGHETLEQFVAKLA